MILRLANREVDTVFPLIEEIFPLHKKFYRESGLTDYAIELNTVQDILSLDALCRTTEPLYRGMYISGTTINLVREGDNTHDYI